MVPLDVISVTERGQFRTCRRRWAWDKERRYPARSIPVALTYGKMMHTALAAYYSNGRTLDDLLAGFKIGADEQVKFLIEDQGFVEEAVLPAIDEMWQQGIDTLTAYADYDHAVTSPSWEVISVEKRHYITISPDLPSLTGQLDLVVTVNGRLCVVDHKNVSRKQDQRAVDIDPQLTGYCFIAKEVYGEIPLALLNTLVKKKPSVTLRAPKLGTTPWDGRFFRLQTDRSADAIDSYAWRAAVEMREMVDVAAEPERAYANPGWQCSACAYLKHCTEDLSGAQTGLGPMPWED